ncbi:hypothetical protein J1N35_038449 [Gossypium stocksii]|uniref:Zinc knuckle CX2CX4HX4C domain-containing protein n=1 Tax=Gossypium stocksii TaxID=47602 RepID=A0A9D3ULW6_9ROSI|nr:hypothetical protein J1N35_038449 [Gossypium stocksii]
MGVELNWVAFWVLVHDIPHSFISENVAKQLGNFIGAFLDYDTSFIQSGNMRFMWIRVKLDVRRSLRRRKKFALPNGVSAYVHFDYEKLSLFYLFGSKLGHGESFYQLRATLSKQNVVFYWDLSLRALPHRAAVWKSKWLVEERTGGDKNLGISHLRKGD